MGPSEKSLEERGKADELSNLIIGAAIEVHRQLGPGLLESVYHACMRRELIVRGVPFENQKPMDLVYKGLHIEGAYRLDLVVGGLVVVALWPALRALWGG